MRVCVHVMRLDFVKKSKSLRFKIRRNKKYGTPCTMSKDDIVACLASSHLSLDGRSIIDNLGRHGYYNGHRGQFFARAASLRSREYADAFLGGGFNYTSHAHTRLFGPATLLGQRWRRRRRRTRRACPKKAGRTLCALLDVYSMRVGVYLIIIL